MSARNLSNLTLNVGKKVLGNRVLSSFALNPRKLPQGSIPALWTSLFAAGEKGVWYDPSDMKTLFQDSAMLIPVTGVEQPVGAILDKSGNGNHAVQAIAPKRPVLSARVNLLNSTEDLLSGGWTARGTTGIDPAMGSDGLQSATRISNLGPSPSNDVFQEITGAVLSASLVPKIRIKKTTATGIIHLRNASDSDNGDWTIDLSLLGSDWEDVVQGHAAVTEVTAWKTAENGSTGFHLTADSAVTFEVEKLGVVTLANASKPYQKVVSATVYDADPTKFPRYLRYDGNDDALSVASLNMGGSSSVFMVAGVSGQNLTSGVIAETGTNVNTTVGSFLLSTTTNAADAAITIRGATSVNIARKTVASYPTVIAGSGNIATPSTDLRINGDNTGVTKTVGDATPTLANLALHTGARAGTSLFLKGNIYGLIIRGAVTATDKVTAAEQFMTSKI